MSNNLIGATLATFTVTLSAAVKEPVDVAWSTRDGTAEAGYEYEAANGVVTFLPGETAKQVQVRVYGSDDPFAADTNFFIEFAPPTNAVLGVTIIEVVISVSQEGGVAVLSVVMPEGRRGLKGDPGLSAYEHAVLMGYEGTVEQWMQDEASASAAATRAEGFAADAAASLVVATDKVDQVKNVGDQKITEMQEISATVSALNDGQEYFQTEAELLASRPVVEKKAAKALDTKRVWLWNKPAGSPDGDYWINTGKSELELANTYSDVRVSELAIEVKLKKAPTSPIIPVLVDDKDQVLIGYDTEKDQIAAGGLQEQIFGQVPNIKKTADTGIIPLLTDQDYRVLIGYNTLTDTPIIAGLDVSSSKQTKQYEYFAQKPLALAVNHILSYGQSLSVGATATTILSVSQPYYNTTFNTGPRQDTAATGVVPLVEQFNNPSADGYTNRGETHCSGMANYASLTMLKENGINPQEHIIFASTAGHGGYTIDQLKKGSAWYSVLLDHVTKAKSLNAGKSYHVPVVPWIQGENNAVSGGLQTPYTTYKAALARLQTDVDADIKAITAQVDPVRFITYQMSYAAATWPDIAKAQLDLARENDNFMLATPMYHFPYAGDRVHLTNIGYKWMGAYFGRAYKQYMIDGRKPDFINPLSAYLKDNKIYIKFDVPTLPLQIDTTTLANTANAGFKVMNGAAEVVISDVSASGDTVIIQLASAPTSDVKVRYALDYLGAGLIITGGASGNLRDSTADSIVISGTTYPLYHVCPHFEMTALMDKGI